MTAHGGDSVRRRLPLGIAVAVLLTLSPDASTSTQTGADLPMRLSNPDFWTLSETLSEPHGTFPNDNLISSELGFQKVMPALLTRAPRGGAYLGVGPEQNFTYIAALEPRIAFIVDIRRGNRDVHLLHKALFELAADRVEYLSLLFSRPRPGGLTKGSSVADILGAFGADAAIAIRAN